MLLFKFHSSLVDDGLVYISRKKINQEKLDLSNSEKMVDLSILNEEYKTNVLHN